MVIQYDPGKSPEIAEETIAYAQQNNMHIFHVICDPKGAQPGDPGGLSFWTASPFLPRVGDYIQLQDKTKCRVAKIIFKTSTFLGDDNRAKIIRLDPNVVAYIE